VRLLAEIVLVVLAGAGLSMCVALLPSPLPAPRRPQTAGPPRPGQLEALERLVITAAGNPVQVHAYLRPRLMEIASRRLAARGQTLERLPDARGRELFGDRLWDIIRPGRPFPEQRDGPGVRYEDLSAMLEALERL